MVSGAAEGQFLVFRVGDLECAIRASSVLEILPAAALSRTPSQPAVLEGFLNLRGAAVPVVKFHRIFELPPSETGLYTPLIVVKSGESTIGLLAGRVEEIASVPADAFRPLLPGHSFNDCAEAQFALGGRSITVLSCDRLLLIQERRRISELQAVAQRRLNEIEASRA
jgi:purine-binding chemotaxis protein CheW